MVLYVGEFRAFVLLVVACLPGALTLGQSKNIVQLVKRTRTAVVMISVKDAFGVERGLGTGFLVSPHDVATNHHVVKGAASITVLTHDSTRIECARILAIDSTNDVALLRLALPAVGHATVLQLKETLPELGEKVYVIGSPLGLDQTVSDGITAGIRKIGSVSETIQFTAPISSGSSGSPLISEDGRVLGIVRSSYEGGQNLNFATPIKTLRFLDTSNTVEFTTSSKQYLGKLVNLREAIRVNDVDRNRPPDGLNTREYNLWLLKSVAVVNGWDSTVIDGQGARLERLVRRFAEKELDEDRLKSEDAERIIDEAFGENSTSKTGAKSVLEKEEYLEAGLTIAAQYVSLSGRAEPLKRYVDALDDQHQEILNLQEGIRYVIISVADDCARDIDAVLFQEKDNDWVPVASDTDPDARPMIWYEPEESGRYAIVWKLARKWKTCEKVVFGALVMSISE